MIFEIYEFEGGLSLMSELTLEERADYERAGAKRLLTGEYPTVKAAQAWLKREAQERYGMRVELDSETPDKGPPYVN